MKTKNFVLGLTVSIVLCGLAAKADSIWTDNFNSYSEGSNLSGQGGWTDTGGGTAYQVTSRGLGGKGITTGAGSTQINWTSHPWDWGTLAVGDKVVVSLDFQANESGQFDDDRVGWVVASSSTSSSYHFGVQLDNSDNSPNLGLGTYFRDNSGNRVLSANLLTYAAMATTANGWYREQLSVTKLTSGLGAGGAKVDVAFWALDGSGNPVGNGLAASYGLIDTSTLRGFSGTVYPMFKNYSATIGSADNAYFGIIQVPEPGSLTLVALGGLAFIVSRRKN